MEKKIMGWFFCQVLREDLLEWFLGTEGVKPIRTSLENYFWRVMPPKTSQSHLYIKSCSRFKSMSPFTLPHSFLKYPYFVGFFVFFFVFFSLKPPNPSGGSESLPQMASPQRIPGREAWARVQRPMSSRLSKPACLWIPITSSAAVSHYPRIFSQNSSCSIFEQLLFLKSMKFLTASC